MPKTLPQTRFVRSIRANQTFDHYAQRLEGLDRAVASGRMSETEGLAKADRLLEQVAYLRQAIREVEHDLISQDIVWERTRPWEKSHH